MDPDTKDACAHKNKVFEDEGDDSSASGTSDLLADGSIGLSFVAPTTEVTDNNPHDDAAFDAAEVSFHQKNTTFTLVTNICHLLCY